MTENQIEFNRNEPHIIFKESGKTQGEYIIDYLKQGYTLTGMGALKLFGTMKLATRISELRKQGFVIKDDMIHDHNTKKKYKRYWMEK